MGSFGGQPYFEGPIQSKSMILMPKAGQQGRSRSGRSGSSRALPKASKATGRGGRVEALPGETLYIEGTQRGIDAARNDLDVRMTERASKGTSLTDAEVAAYEKEYRTINQAQSVLDSQIEYSKSKITKWNTTVSRYDGKMSALASDDQGNLIKDENGYALTNQQYLAYNLQNPGIIPDAVMNSSPVDQDAYAEENNQLFGGSTVEFALPEDQQSALFDTMVSTEGDLTPKARMAKANQEAIAASRGIALKDETMAAKKRQFMEAINQEGSSSSRAFNLNFNTLLYNIENVEASALGEPSKPNAPNPRLDYKVAYDAFQVFVKAKANEVPVDEDDYKAAKTKLNESYNTLREYQIESTIFDKTEAGSHIAQTVKENMNSIVASDTYKKHFFEHPDAKAFIPKQSDVAEKAGTIHIDSEAVNNIAFSILKGYNDTAFMVKNEKVFDEVHKQYQDKKAELSKELSGEELSNALMKVRKDLALEAYQSVLIKGGAQDEDINKANMAQGQVSENYDSSLGFTFLTTEKNNYVERDITPAQVESFYPTLSVGSTLPSNATFYFLGEKVSSSALGRGVTIESVSSLKMNLVLPEDLDADGTVNSVQKGLTLTLRVPKAQAEYYLHNFSVSLPDEDSLKKGEVSYEDVSFNDLAKKDNDSGRITGVTNWESNDDFWSFDEGEGVASKKQNEEDHVFITVTVMLDGSLEANNDQTIRAREKDPVSKEGVSNPTKTAMTNNT